MFKAAADAVGDWLSRRKEPFYRTDPDNVIGSVTHWETTRVKRVNRGSFDTVAKHAYR